MSALQTVRKTFPQVNKVVDARKPISVEVGRQDQAAGKRKSHQKCVFAEACKRKHNLDGMIVSLGRAYLFKGDTATRCEVPESVTREIVSYDRGAGFKAGKYSLSPVCKSSRFGARVRKRGRVTGTGHKRTLRHRTKGIRAILR